MPLVADLGQRLLSLRVLLRAGLGDAIVPVEVLVIVEIGLDGLNETGMQLGNALGLSAGSCPSSLAQSN